jgi:hypothetical protein
MRDSPKLAGGGEAGHIMSRSRRLSETTWMSSTGEVTGGHETKLAVVGVSASPTLAGTLVPVSTYWQPLAVPDTENLKLGAITVDRGGMLLS